MGQRNWANVPAFLLCAIAARLTAEAYARVCAVCTDWASSVLPQEWEDGQRQSYYLPRSLHCPWLMVSSYQDEPSTGYRTFLSLPEYLLPYRFYAPQLVGKEIIGSHAGWLAVVHTDCNVSLINPLSRSQIPLPSITTVRAPVCSVKIVRDPISGSPVQQLVAYATDGVPESITLEQFRDLCLVKIILSSSPSASPGNYIVVMIFYHCHFMAFARAGDTRWSILDRVRPHDYGFLDAVFLDRKLYAVGDNGQIDVFDFTETNPQPTMVAKTIARLGYSYPRYLVFSSGDLLHIQRVQEQGVDYGTVTTLFMVEKINITGRGKWKRVPVKDLGSQSLFLGGSQSLSVSTQGISGVKPNCIYFTDHNVSWFFRGNARQYPRDMGVFDMKEWACKALYPPDAWLMWPPPIWFAPVSN